MADVSQFRPDFRIWGLLCPPSPLPISANLAREIIDPWSTLFYVPNFIWIGLLCRRKSQFWEKFSTVDDSCTHHPLSMRAKFGVLVYAYVPSQTSPNQFILSLSGSKKPHYGVIGVAFGGIPTKLKADAKLLTFLYQVVSKSFFYTPAYSLQQKRSTVIGSTPRNLRLLIIFVQVLTLTPRIRETFSPEVNNPCTICLTIPTNKLMTCSHYI